MSNRIELSKTRAKKLVECWEAHVKQEIDAKECKEENCLIHKYFMQLKKKVKT